MPTIAPIRLVAKCCLGLALVSAGAIGIWRLEQTRPIDQLEYAGAEIVRAPDRGSGFVNFTGSGAGDEHLAEIAQLSSVTSINLARSRVTRQGLRQLKELPRLSRLDLSGTRDAAGCLSELEAFPALRHLDLRDCSWVHDDDLAALAGLDQLETLILSRTPISNAGVSHLTGLQRLSYVQLDGCADITEDGLQLLARAPALRRLCAPGIRVRRAVVRKMLAAAPELEIQVQVDYSDLQPLYELGARVSIDETEDVTAIQIDGDWDTPPTLSRKGAVRTGFEADAALTNATLAEKLEYYETIRANRAQIDDRIAVVRNFPGIRQLTLSNVPLTDRGMEHIVTLRNLGSLYLRNVRITGAGIGQLDKLFYFHVSTSPESLLTDQTLREIGKLKELWRLLLKVPVAETELSVLARLSKLETLWLTGPLPETELAHLPEIAKLTEVGLHRLHLTSEGIEALVACRGLTRMHFRECRFAEGSLFELQGAPSLRGLEFRDCDVNEDDVMQLASRIPKVKVHIGWQQVSGPVSRRSGDAPIARRGTPYDDFDDEY